MQRVHLFVTERAGEPLPVIEDVPQVRAPSLAMLSVSVALTRAQVTLLHVPGLADVSSSAARAALAAGDDAAAARLLHPAVLAYARQHELYAS